MRAKVAAKIGRIGFYRGLGTSVAKKLLELNNYAYDSNAPIAFVIGAGNFSRSTTGRRFVGGDLVIFLPGRRVTKKSMEIRLDVLFSHFLPLT